MHSNIFLDHGFAADEATVLALKSDVARAIRGAMAGARQGAFARRAGVAQSDVSKILRGDLTAISLERLIRITVRLQVEMSAQWGRDAHHAAAVASMPAGGTVVAFNQSAVGPYQPTSRASYAVGGASV